MILLYQFSNRVYNVQFLVYPDGRVCISILHPPGEDPNGYELASERWTPVHTVGSFLQCIQVFFSLCSLAQVFCPTFL